MTTRPAHRTPHLTSGAFCVYTDDMQFFRVPQNAKTLIDKATEYVGYRAKPNRVQPFGPDGLPWDGSFIDRCLADADLTTGVNHHNTTAALAGYLRNNQTVPTNQARPGDLVFFAFGVGGLNAQPHVGIVSKPSNEAGVIYTIEAEVTDGHRTDPVAVSYKRRFVYDVLVIVRPNFEHNIQYSINQDMVASKSRETIINLIVRPSHFVLGRSHRSVELVQLGLGAMVKLQDAPRGLFDVSTRSAYAAWQRQCGVPATGMPDVISLQRLSACTGNGFIVES